MQSQGCTWAIFPKRRLEVPFKNAALRGNHVVTFSTNESAWNAMVTGTL